LQALPLQSKGFSPERGSEKRATLAR